MSVYLACLAIGSGTPLFIRKKSSATSGNSEDENSAKSLPYPILAALNGVAVYGEQHNSTLVSADCGGHKLIWREYHKSVRFLLWIQRQNDDEEEEREEDEGYWHHLMDMAFQASVFIVGIEDLLDVDKNQERLRRDLRSCFPLVDRLLELSIGICSNGYESLTFNDVSGYSDVAVFPEAPEIHSSLESFVESVDSTYGMNKSNQGSMALTEGFSEVFLRFSTKLN